jgi:diguanylate cyclase
MMLNRIKSQVTQILQLHHEFGDRLVGKSFSRLFILSVIATPVSAAHVLVFSGMHLETGAEQQWQRGIMLYHGIMFLLFSVLTWWTRPALKLSVDVQKRISRVIHALVLAAGVAVTSIDQLVTPAVTPFLVACTVAGALFIVNPLTALILYSALFGFYSIALTLTQTDPVILTSNLVNGLTACCIAVGLSWILWQQNIRTLQQQDVIFHQQHELELSNRQLELLATRDDLTGLANRRMLQMLAAEEQTLMVRQNTPACLLLLDLDLFKNINDELGHPAGDELLRQLGTLLTQTVRASDRVARWGGEEFAILLRNSDANQGLQVAEHIRAFIEQHHFELPNQAGVHHEIVMTASIGVAQLDAKADDMLDQAYRSADMALYAAKAGGRNRVVLHASAA